jgi:hypothetical protein
MTTASDADWPTFEDPFLGAVMERVRSRSTHLWDRGRLFIEGDSGPSVAEALIVTRALHLR